MLMKVFQILVFVVLPGVLDLAITVTPLCPSIGNVYAKDIAQQALPQTKDEGTATTLCSTRVNICYAVLLESRVSGMAETKNEDGRKPIAC